MLPLLQLLPLLAVGWLVGLSFRDLRRARKHRKPPPYNLLPLTLTPALTLTLALALTPTRQAAAVQYPAGHPQG